MSLTLLWCNSIFQQNNTMVKERTESYLIISLFNISPLPPHLIIRFDVKCQINLSISGQIRKHIVSKKVLASKGIMVSLFLTRVGIWKYHHRSILAVKEYLKCWSHDVSVQILVLYKTVMDDVNFKSSLNSSLIWWMSLRVGNCR